MKQDQQAEYNSKFTAITTDELDPDVAPSHQAIIDISQDDLDDNEEIELDEHDLFLHEDYAKFRDLEKRTATSQQQQQIRPDGTNSRNRSHSIDSDYDIDKNLVYANGSRHGSNTSGSTNYQQPNYQRFAGSLAPSSPASVLVSFTIIIVILCFTILPIIIFQTPSSDSDIYDEEYMTQFDDDNFAKGTNDSPRTQIEHADVRCKCICPPTKLTHGNLSSESSSGKLSQRRLYVGNTPPDQCSCDSIVEPHLNDTQNIKDFCARCQCRYQSRNTATIRRNILFFMTVLTLLGAYMSLQWIFKYLRITRRNLAPRYRWLYHQLSDDG